VAVGPDTLDLTHQRLFGFLNGGLVRCVMGFAIGLALYRTWPSGGAGWLRGTPAILSLLAVGGLLLLVTNYGALTGADWACALLLFPLLVVLATTDGSPVNRVFRLRPLVWLGSISYAVYLCQFPLAYVVKRSGDALRHVGVAFAPPVTGLVYLGALIMVAALAHRAIELPAAAWLRRRWTRGTSDTPLAQVSGAGFTAARSTPYSAER
jgi:peptidoglycan/LPS O-acetylase OafA/YrhL